MDLKEALAGLKTSADLKAHAPALYESLVKEIGDTFRRRMEPEIRRLTEEAATKRLNEEKAAGRLIEAAGAAKRGKLDEAVKAFAAALEEAGVVTKLPPSDKVLAEENAALKAKVAALNEENDKLAAALNEASDVIESNVLRESVRAAAAKNDKVVGHPLRDEIVLRALSETTKPTEAAKRLDEAVAYFDGLSTKLAPGAAPAAKPGNGSGSDVVRRAVGFGMRAPSAPEVPPVVAKRLDESAGQKKDGKVDMRRVLGLGG